MTNLIGLSGYARVGKDTVAKILAEHGYRRASFADILREAALALDPMIDTAFHGECARLSDLVNDLGWETAKDSYPDVRRLLQRLGTDVGRNIFGEDCWVDLAMARCGWKAGQIVEGDRVVFTDVRFPNEAEAIRAHGGVVWRVARPGYGPVNGHPSETALDTYDFDNYVMNTADLEHLRDTVDLILGHTA